MYIVLGGEKKKRKERIIVSLGFKRVYLLLHLHCKTFEISEQVIHKRASRPGATLPHENLACCLLEIHTE